jgi:hypothetical protein
MSTQLVALDKNVHNNIRIKTNNIYEHAKNQNLISIQIHEFIACGTNYPIVLVKSNETGEFIPTAMLGLQPGENLFYNDSGWNAGYIPSTIRLHPFSAHKNSNDEIVLCIDVNSKSIDQGAGNPLFNEAGEETPYLNQIIDKLSDHMAQNLTTKEFIKYLVEKQLISPYSLTIQDKNIPQGSYVLKGFYIVDQKKLQALSDSDFLELRNKHYLPFIYTHLFSLNIIEKMASQKLKNQAAQL